MKPTRLTSALLSVSLLLAPALPGCKSAYYGMMEKFGVQKREIVVQRVEAGREQQAEAKEQIQTTFETFKELTGFDGGDLEEIHGRLETEYERCEREAKKVNERIDSIEEVAQAMFDEWRLEINEMSDAKLRGQSEDLLRDTERDYDSLITSMRRAEEKMEPVLSAFKDQVLFLKHNLNARAIASLQDTVIEIESDVANLIEEMQKSIDEADAFIESMGA